MSNLLFCMTPGVGLSDWEKIGTLHREIRSCQEYSERGWNVKVLTFDKGKIPDLPKGIEAVRFSDRKLLWLLPWTHKRLGAWADLIKTNQSIHAFFYTNAAKHWGKPILVRCGYVHGEYLDSTFQSGPKARLYKLMERNAFRNSTYSEVPTLDLLKWVVNNYEVSDKKISVVPNFVETDVFKPLPEVNKKETSVVSVGRLMSVKRFDLLIKACAEIPGCSLTIIGEGPERPKLTQLAEKHKVLISLPGNIPNHQLPRAIQEHTVFVIVSSWEGHPKALIEAMACGMPCVGAESPGVQNVITHRATGLLVKALLPSIKDAISSLMHNSELRSNLSREAHKYINEKYSFNACYSKEYNIVQSMLA